MARLRTRRGWWLQVIRVRVRVRVEVKERGKEDIFIGEGRELVMGLGLFFGLVGELEKIKKK